ncbi:glutamate receptor [Senna tora]|uniref:Glutamate receptor n=1 Tax=Senna tora TaxID=362788 RepID=A0A834W821_9FABA|nr:glutamate receptor [Senna tora]
MAAPCSSASFGSSSSLSVSEVSSRVQTYSLFSSSSQATTVKLDRSNFLLWELVVLSLIEGNKLTSHINGLVSPPARVIAASDGAEATPNPAYEDWYTTDRLLMGWLRNTISIEIASQLLCCQTTYELWTTAKTLTAASVRSRVLVLRADLQQTRKNSLTMEKYNAIVVQLLNQGNLSWVEMQEDGENRANNNNNTGRGGGGARSGFRGGSRGRG